MGKRSLPTDTFKWQQAKPVQVNLRENLSYTGMGYMIPETDNAKTILVMDIEEVWRYIPELDEWILAVTWHIENINTIPAEKLHSVEWL